MNLRQSDSSAHKKEASDRTFGFLFCAIFFLMGGISLFSGGRIRLWAFIVSSFFLAVSLACPSLLSVPHRLWMKFGLLLHRIISPVVLAGLFFLIVTPYALVLRIFRKDVLLLSREPESDSYWIIRTSDEAGKSLMSNQF